MDQLFEAAASASREHATAMVRPQVLDRVHLLWLNDSVLGVYADVEEARRVAAEVRHGAVLHWDENGRDRWTGLTESLTLVATMSIEMRRIG